MTVNPFKPTAGATPPLLIGRDDALQGFALGLDDGPGAPGRLTLFTGARGVGKTVMLTEVGDLARRRGWAVIDLTATPGLSDRLVSVASDRMEDLDAAPRPGRAVTGMSVAGLGGFSLAPPPPRVEVRLQGALEALLEVLEERRTGLLITIDEVHRKSLADLREIAATYQHLVRAARDVALVVAGLPSSVEDLLNDDVLTFLRRADRQTLSDVPLTDVRRAFQATIADARRTIDDDALDIATTATGGYPFMIQLVGYHVWRSAEDGSIDRAAADTGVAAARVRLGSTVHEANVNALSAVDRTYLVAMAQDNGPSRTSDVAGRMDRDMRYQSVYRDRLIAAGIIRPTGHGMVDFAIPYLREYLLEQAARYELSTRQSDGG